MMDTRRSEIVFADPWLNQKSKFLPKDLRFVCTYELDMGPDAIDQATFLRKTEERDELWITSGINLSRDKSLGCAFAAFPFTDELSACLNLLVHLFRAYVGFYWPTKLIAPGIVDDLAFKSLVGRIERELEGNTEKARQRETEIIRVARELGLYPEPTGTGPDYWQARCPKRNHPLYINAALNSFGCGWCKRKGAVEELRAFVEERRLTIIRQKEK